MDAWHHSNDAGHKSHDDGARRDQIQRWRPGQGKNEKCDLPISAAFGELFE
jgi:hypothetical protein